MNISRFPGSAALRRTIWAILTLLVVAGGLLFSVGTTTPLALAAPHAPHASNPATSVVLVHGFNGGDGSSGSTTNGNANGDCNAYWGDAKTFLSASWSGDIRTVQYYTNEPNCNENGNEHGDSANLHDSLYASHCSSYNAGNEGTNNESLFHISCLFAWYLYYNFGQHNWEEVLVGHSMGGLIIRETMYQVQNRASLDTGNTFPSTIGHVTDAITFNTPHKGVPGIASLGCGGCTQLTQMGSGNWFMQELMQKGQAPQAGATDWTVVASSCDGLVGTGALGMWANHKVLFNGSPTCYDHGGAIHDPSTSWNGSQLYCDTSTPSATICAYQSDVADWFQCNTSCNHGLEEMLDAIQFATF